MFSDSQRIDSLGNEPDLFWATSMVDGVIECLQGVTVGQLGMSDDIERLIQGLAAFTREQAVSGLRDALTQHGREELSEHLQEFAVAGRELLGVLRSFDEQTDGEPVKRFEALQPSLTKLKAAHGAFYLKFLEM